ncbi:hypothetical protein [Cupriavidus basilensis]|uniref:hypothetical protein n=1 Tax=Cupriavidus basilensis TaxID=68895 RepID=UPI000750AD5C|nr:hypothetical protein [Cupriavidus basilensis]
MMIDEKDMQSEPSAGAQQAEPVAPSAGDNYLCKAWGETDFPAAAIVTGLDGVRAFLVAEWLGSEDHQDDDGTNSLDAALQDMQEQWALEGEAWEWSIEFEIGGVSVQKVGHAAPAPSASPAALTDALAQIGAILGPGSNELGTLLVCIRNVKHFADCLDAVEREFFMVPGEPDEDDPDSEPSDECLLNRWGSTVEQYVEQFRTAIPHLLAASPDYKARFETMVYMIGEISNALGIPDDEASCANGNDLILSAIAKLRATAPAAQAHAWIVVKEHVWEHGDGQRPTLAYLWPSEFGQEVFPSYEAAIKFIRDGDWPLGFVAMRIGVPAAQQSAIRAEATTPQPSAKALTDALHYLRMGMENLALNNGVHMVDFRNAERALLAAEQPSEDKRDAGRYRWLRERNWNESALFVVQGLTPWSGWARTAPVASAWTPPSTPQSPREASHD